MKRGDMVRHTKDPMRARGVVTQVTQSSGILVQWGNGDLVTYETNQMEYIESLGWNLYIK